MFDTNLATETLAGIAVAAVVVVGALAWRASRPARQRAQARALAAMPAHELLQRIGPEDMDPDGLNPYAKEYFRRLDNAPPR
jgi:hypothetical protein